MVWESNACVRYLAARYGAGRLWPEDVRRRAQADMWMDWQVSTLLPDMTVVFWGLIRTPEAERDYPAIEAAARRLGATWQILDAAPGHPPLRRRRHAHDRRHPGRRQLLSLLRAADRAAGAAQRSSAGTARLKRAQAVSRARHGADHLRRRAMRYRPFGRTGLQVSELVFGGGWVGGILIHQDPRPGSRRSSARSTAGINWIDTAPSYGDGESERALGWLLEDVEDRPYLSTKVRLDLSRLDDIIGQVKRSTEESLSRLRCDLVELLQLHNPIGPQTVDQLIGVDQVLGEDGVADALERMREAGPDPAHRHHRDRRYRGLPPGDRERPVRTRPRSTTTSSIRAPARTCRPPGRGATFAA